jgi:hypothetical protein
VGGIPMGWTARFSIKASYIAVSVYVLLYDFGELALEKRLIAYAIVCALGSQAYDAERDAKRARQPRRAKAAGPRAASRSRYALDPAVIAAGKLPDKAPIVTSAANPHYQKRFDELHKLAAAGDWAAVRDYKVSGSNSYSKLVARYQQNLLALNAASEAAQ